MIRLEGESNYTRLFFVNDKPLLLSRTLKDFEDILRELQFLRIHKSHLINPTHVVNFTADGIITLADGSRVEVSRRRREEVRDALITRRL